MTLVPSIQNGFAEYLQCGSAFARANISDKSSVEVLSEFYPNPECSLFLIYTFASVLYSFFVVLWGIIGFHGYPFTNRYVHAMALNFYIFLILLEKSVCEICYYNPALVPIWKSWPVIRSLQISRFIVGLKYTHFQFLSGRDLEF